jgi:PBSX family phage terminase large subunit
MDGVGKKGLNVILGVSKETIERNVLEPMRDLWGDDLVSIINSRNFATIFGEKVYCLGAEKVSQVSKLRGAKFKYVYIDEIVDINEQVFQLVKSRMSLPYSKCDASGNPSYPSHFVKEFIDSADRGVDVYCQEWTLYDNPFLAPSYVQSLEREYAGTVFFDRYILGRWTRAEGLLFPQFASNPSNWAITYDEVMELPINQIFIGFDVGGTKSHSVFVATGIVGNYQKQVRLLEKVVKHDKGTVDPDILYEAYGEFIKQVREYYPAFPITKTFVDNEAQVIENGLRSYSKQHRLPAQVADCRKVAFADRVLTYNFLLNTGKIAIVESLCPSIIKSLSTMAFRDKDEDSLLDDYTTDVDTYDADFYSWSHYMEYFHTRAKYKRGNK